jgi:glycosyltransferase involved in cell wall biosynthesis
MRIAIHDYAGFPFPLELSSELSKRRHHVLHLFSESSGGPKASFKNRGDGQLRIVNIGGDRVEKDNYLKRWFQERRYGDLAVKALDKWQPDIVISANTPLEAQQKIIHWAGRRSIPSIFWLQDLLSVAAKSIISKVSRPLGQLLYTCFNKIEADTLARADHIVSITDDFIPFLKQWNIDPAKISVIPNWGPIEQIPVLARNNRWSEYYGLNEKFVVLYAGTLGKKQNIQLIADVTATLAADDAIRVVVATDQRGQQLLMQQLSHRKLKNLINLPLQPSHLYPYLLASSDVSLVTLEKSAGRYCVPSKLWAAYCAQKPSIVAVDQHNVSARVTESIHAGIVVPPGSVTACITAIRQLKKNQALRASMGKNARQYAERHFPISPIADTFEKKILQVMAN